MQFDGKKIKKLDFESLTFCFVKSFSAKSKCSNKIRESSRSSLNHSLQVFMNEKSDVSWQIKPKSKLKNLRLFDENGMKGKYIMKPTVTRKMKIQQFLEFWHPNPFPSVSSLSIMIPPRLNRLALLAINWYLTLIVKLEQSQKLTEM